MYGTGRIYGLEINSLVDERRDPVKSTHAAARFAKDLYEIYHDWLLVIAAYNCGPGNVNKAIRRSGGKTNYWDIYYYLPRETRGHVPAFIAATYIMNFYREHNLTPAKVDIPALCDTLHIKQELHLQQVAEVLGIPLKQLRDLNPQYRHDIIPAGKKTYALTLPAEFAGEFIDKEQDICVYKDSVFLNKDNVTISPARSYSYQAPTPPGDDYVKLRYVVKTGDNLGYIASWYDVRISDLKYWNSIHRNMIRSGQKLTVYKHKNKVSKYKAINDMSFAEKQAMIGKPVVPADPGSKPSPAPAGDGNYVMYTVRYGDNLWEIAKKFPGVSYTDLMKLNNLSETDKIKPGQTIKIKPK
jgi:membrane-bound lytic murein transglycosylase D